MRGTVAGSSAVTDSVVTVVDADPIGRPTAELNPTDVTLLLVFWSVPESFPTPPAISTPTCTRRPMRWNGMNLRISTPVIATPWVTTDPLVSKHPPGNGPLLNPPGVSRLCPFAPSLPGSWTKLTPQSPEVIRPRTKPTLHCDPLMVAPLPLPAISLIVNEGIFQRGVTEASSPQCEISSPAAGGGAGAGVAAVWARGAGGRR